MKCAEFIYLFLSADQLKYSDHTERLRNVSSYLGEDNLTNLMQTINVDRFDETVEKFISTIKE